MLSYFVEYGLLRLCVFELSEVSKAEGRVGQTTNVVIGGTVTDDSTNEWLSLDQKVELYCSSSTLMAHFNWNTGPVLEGMTACIVPSYSSLSNDDLQIEWWKSWTKLVSWLILKVYILGRVFSRLDFRYLEYVLIWYHTCIAGELLSNV